MSGGKLTSKMMSTRQNCHPDVMRECHLTPPHVTYFLAPVGFMEILIGYARKEFLSQAKTSDFLIRYGRKAILSSSHSQDNYKYTLPLKDLLDVRAVKPRLIYSYLVFLASKGSPFSEQFLLFIASGTVWSP